MNEARQELEMALSSIIKNIVSDDKFTINSHLEDSLVTLSVKAPSSELGKIIGKGGDMASSIRKVLRAMGKKRGVGIKFSIDNRPEE